MFAKLLGLLGYVPKPPQKPAARSGGSTGRSKKNIDIAGIIADKKSGLSNREIAKKNNVSEFLIRQRLKDAPPPPITSTPAPASAAESTSDPTAPAQICGICKTRMTYRQNARFGDQYFYCKKCGNQISTAARVD